MLMAVGMRVNSNKIISMVMAIFFGKIKDSMWVYGKTAKWKERELLFGQTGGDMKANTQMIKSKVMGNLFGLMGEYIKVNGKMANKMVKDCLKIKRVYKKEEFGAKAKMLDEWNDNF